MTWLRTLLTAVIALAVTTACGGRGVLVYPPPSSEPGDDWPASSTGPDCSGKYPGCVDVSVGSGDPVRAFAQVTMRVTVEDAKPPATHGPILLTFVYPAVDKIPFRGRDRTLSTFMFADDNPGRAGAEAFFSRDAPAMFGPDVVGMRTGGTRRLTQMYAGRLGPFDLPPGQSRQFTLTLVQVCYPKLYVSSHLRTTWFDGSGSPIVLDPRLSVEGCGQR